MDDDEDVLTGLSFEKKDRNTGPPKPATRMGNAVLVPLLSRGAFEVPVVLAVPARAAFAKPRLSSKVGSGCDTERPESIVAMCEQQYMYIPVGRRCEPLVVAVSALRRATKEECDKEQPNDA